jgi:formylmethanofuran dehydrogenase subunit D
MPATFLLIPGRTARQGTSLNEGKFCDEYVHESSTVLVCPDDLKRLGLAYGDLSSRLMGGDTHGTGMPTSKGIDVEVEVG